MFKKNIEHSEIYAKRQVIVHQNFTLLTNKCRRYMAEIFPIRRKTQTNQSVNRSTVLYIKISQYLKFNYQRHTVHHLIRNLTFDD